MPERAYLSIGEVLALLKDEFADITISKIRFLESQGLIDPERTPSGYRKFYEPDVERLRWILRQQKEHYLPLRVIKGKLSEAPSSDGGAHEPIDEAEASEPVAGPPTLAAVPDPPDDGPEINGAGPPAEHDQDDQDDQDVQARRAVARSRAEPAGSGGRAEPAGSGGRAEPAGSGGRAEAAGSGGRAEPAGSGGRTERAGSGGSAEHEGGSRRPVAPFPESLRRSARSSPTGFLTAPEPPQPLHPPPAPAVPASPAPATPAATAQRNVGGADVEGIDEEIELTADEMAAAAGLPVPAVAELERYGLVKGQPGPGGRYYDAAALEVAQLAAGFARFGVEARHLKMWKTAADREADFYEQVVTPLRSQRSNKARREAGDNVAELAGLGARLHAALVAGAMKRLT